MKIGSADAPGSLRVTVSDGMRRSGRVRHVGDLGGAGLCDVRAPEMILPRAPVSASPTAPAPAERSNCLRVTVWLICTLRKAHPGKGFLSVVSSLAQARRRNVRDAPRRSRSNAVSTCESDPREAVLARLGAALEQAELDQRECVAMGGGRAHAELFGDFHDPTRTTIGAEAREDRQPAQQ